jgi:hypothetical protein
MKFCFEEKMSVHLNKTNRFGSFDVDSELLKSKILNKKISTTPQTVNQIEERIVSIENRLDL